jgi:hypothetical protein
MSRVTGRVKPMLADALRYLCTGDGTYLYHLAIHLVHSISGGWR